jgi:hypothetical protein
MRAIIGVMILAAGLGLASAPSAVAAPVGVDFRGAGFLEGVLERVQYGRGGYCERLRRACIYKEERGEVGEGNCRRYRQECGGRVSYCERFGVPAFTRKSAARWVKATAAAIATNAEALGTCRLAFATKIL